MKNAKDIDPICLYSIEDEVISHGVTPQARTEFFSGAPHVGCVREFTISIDSSLNHAVSCR